MTLREKYKKTKTNKTLMWFIGPCVTWPLPSCSVSLESFSPHLPVQSHTHHNLAILIRYIKWFPASGPLHKLFSPHEKLSPTLYRMPLAPQALLKCHIFGDTSLTPSPPNPAIYPNYCFSFLSILYSHCIFIV